MYGVGAVEGEGLKRKKGSDSVEDSLLSSLRVSCGAVGPYTVVGVVVLVVTGRLRVWATAGSVFVVVFLCRGG
jgi:hypothetical protein